MRRAAVVAMLTTIGLWLRAMLRNVDASMAPSIGAEFFGGAVRSCAEESGVISMREAITMPIAIDATAMSAP